jgi:hypothetical protein
MPPRQTGTVNATTEPVLICPLPARRRASDKEGITAITNRVEAFHGFSEWLTFGNAGVITTTTRTR